MDDSYLQIKEFKVIIDQKILSGEKFLKKEFKFTIPFVNEFSD